MARLEQGFTELGLKRAINGYQRAADDPVYRTKRAAKEGINRYLDEDLKRHYAAYAEQFRMVKDRWYPVKPLDKVCPQGI